MNINKKLINFMIFIFITFLMYQSKNLWIMIFVKLYKIIFPFLIAFSIAYALNPYLIKLQRLNIPKTISITIVLLIVIFIFTIILLLLIPMFFKELGNLFNAIILFISDIQMNYDLDFGPLADTLENSFNDIIKYYGKVISNRFIPFISISINYISNIIIILSAAIYFLIDMDNIRNYIKEYTIKKNIYSYIKELDNSMIKYIEGFTKIILITFFEYTISFLLIGHPNALLLGFFASISNLIPYFGGLIVNIISLITAFVISSRLFVRTLILFLVLSIIDSYIINPYIYSKSNQMHPILVIISVFSGGILFGILGVIISLPITILILTTIKYYKKS